MKLKDRHIFVTGGADGIGAGIVLDAVEEGAKVSFCDIDVEKSTDYEKYLAAKSYPIFFHYADVADFESVANAHEASVAKFGVVTGLVNNAGVNSSADPVKMTNDEWERFFGVDLKSVWHTAKLVLPGMRAAKYGSIVNISSIHARMTYPNFFPYAAAKSGVIGLTRNLALDEGIIKFEQMLYLRVIPLRHCLKRGWTASQKSAQTPWQSNRWVGWGRVAKLQRWSPFCFLMMPLL